MERRWEIDAEEEMQRARKGVFMPLFGCEFSFFTGDGEFAGWNIHTKKDGRSKRVNRIRLRDSAYVCFYGSFQGQTCFLGDVDRHLALITGSVRHYKSRRAFLWTLSTWC